MKVTSSFSLFFFCFGEIDKWQAPEAGSPWAEKWKWENGWNGFRTSGPSTYILYVWRGLWSMDLHFLVSPCYESHAVRAPFFSFLFFSVFNQISLGNLLKSDKIFFYWTLNEIKLPSIFLKKYINIQNFEKTKTKQNVNVKL